MTKLQHTFILSVLAAFLVTCPLLATAECTRGGKSYEAGHRLAVTGRNECQGDIEGTAITGYDVCQPDGGWFLDDDIVHCFDGERCAATDGDDNSFGCVPITCTDYVDGEDHDIGALLRRPQYDQCSGENTIRRAFDKCNIYGEWDDSDEFVPCPADHECLGRQESTSCKPIISDSP